VRLHAVYRATGKVNLKPRPAGFSKPRCLASFLCAWESCPQRGEVVFVNDGEVPGDMRAAMAEAGRVLTRAGLDLHGSYWAAIRLAAAAPWGDGDLVYFAEDDYQYRPDAFTGLTAAAAALPGFDYFAPYGNVGTEMPNGEPLTPDLRSPGLRGEWVADAGGVAWHRATSHTSSFAVRLAALRADRVLHLLAPRCSAAWDHALCLTLQHRAPYTPRGLLRPLHEPSGATPSRRAKIVVWRLALTVEALLSRRRRRIAAPRPSLATHMEQGLLALGTDWTAL
jgi:hypothetical protein